MLSPVPFNPITIPYPKSWLVLIPAIETKSFNLSAKTDCKNKLNNNAFLNRLLKQKQYQLDISTKYFNVFYELIQLFVA